ICPKAWWSALSRSSACGAKRARAIAFALMASSPCMYEAASWLLRLSCDSPSRKRPTRTWAVSASSSNSRSRMVASTPSTSCSACARSAIRVDCTGLVPPCMAASFLHAHHFTKDLVADAETAAFDDAAGIFLHEHRTVDRAARPVIAQGAVVADGLEHAVEGLLEEHGFEIVGGLARLGAFRVERILDGLGCALRHSHRGRDRERCQRSHHHITSISACRAPDALIACRIAIRSRGPIPSALRPSTSSRRVTPSRTSASLLASPVSTFRPVRGT